MDIIDCFVGQRCHWCTREYDDCEVGWAQYDTEAGETHTACPEHADELYQEYLADNPEEENIQ